MLLGKIGRTACKERVIERGNSIMAPLKYSKFKFKFKVHLFLSEHIIMLYEVQNLLTCKYKNMKEVLKNEQILKNVGIFSFFLL